MKKFYLVCTALLVVLSVQGCASSRSGSVYTRDQARQAQEVKLGVIEDIREVRIEGTEGAVGTITGTVAGAVAGSAVGQGRGSALAAIAGALIGGLAGAAAEEGITQSTGLEITVRLDSGATLAVVQEPSENEVLRIGSRVRVLTDYNGVSRVQPQSAYSQGVYPSQAPAQTQPAPATTYPIPGR